MVKAGLNPAVARERLAPVLVRVERFVREGEVDGAALAVAVGGELVAETYVGQAAPGRPAAPDTLWPLASTSKLYTTAAVLALVERGELTLSTPVQAVLPEFEGEGKEQVTLRHLLTHTSGLIYESPTMEEILRRQTPLEEIVDEASVHPLQFAPGTRFGYSDFGIALAARLATTVTRQPFPALVRALVLDPGDLRETFMPPAPADYPRVANVVGSLAYGTDSAMYNSPYALALAHPAFGTVASVRDLLRFGLLFAPSGERRILSEATIRAMTTDQTGGAVQGSLVGLTPETRQPWGLGFAVRGSSGAAGLGDLTSPSAFGHPGASGCTLVVDPEYDLTIAFVSNRHLRTGPERWLFRLDAVVNGVVAALTRREP